VRAEHLPELLVPALADEVQVDLAEAREETVRVVVGVRAAFVRHLEPVVGDLRHRQHAGEDAVPLPREFDPLAAEHHGDAVGPRSRHTDRHGAVVRVGAEDRVRVVMVTGEQAVELAARYRRGRCGLRGAGSAGHVADTSYAASRSTAAIGMGNHDGRLRASYTTL
jgi:hypothetical protein